MVMAHMQPAEFAKDYYCRLCLFVCLFVCWLFISPASRLSSCYFIIKRVIAQSLAISFRKYLYLRVSAVMLKIGVFFVERFNDARH